MNKNSESQPGRYPLLESLLRQKGRALQGIYKYKDTAEIFDASVRTIQQFVRDGKLRGRDLPGRGRFLFRTLETKTGHLIHGILPRQIAVPLEEYLKNFRPILVSGADPGTVFLTENGQPFTRPVLGYHVQNATFRYFGRRVNPHLFRDIFAVKFLEEHPENYLTLSKILWHRNVNTTIRLYGRNYDESHGARAAEDWLDQRSRKNQK